MNSQNNDEFAYWLQVNEIVDSSSFRTSGGVVWLKEGVRIKDAFCKLVSEIFTSSGFIQVELPFFIPPEVYTRQPQHYQGLSSLTYKVVSFDEATSLFLRTTSETPFTYLFQNWLSRYGLPLRFFQVIAVFRHETSSRLKPLLRSREINPFIESYSALPSFEAASSQIFDEVSIYKKVLDSLCIPYLLHRRPLFDTFPEARYTMAFDVVLPDGQVYQIATVHHLGDSFGRAFDIRTDGNSYIWQTSTGISGRAIGCTLAIHCDAKGVILPYALSPRQIRIWCSDSNQNNRRLTLQRRLIEADIAKAGLIELSFERDSESQEDWFNRGGCIDVFLDEKNVIITSRNSEVVCTRFSNAIEGIQHSIEHYTDWLKSRAKSVLDKHLSDVPMSTALEQGYTGIIQRPHCGEETCMERIRDMLSGVGQVLGSDDTQATNGLCEFCNRPAVTIIRIAMSKVDYH